MKATLRFSLLLTCFLSVFVLFNTSAQKASGKKASAAKPAKAKAAETVVYLVRHAEKAASDGTMTDDPDLSEAGWKRAEVLRTQLASVPVSALFATKYKRTQQTLQPLATARKQAVQLYEAHDFAGFAQKIQQKYAGKTVVVAGHSNTVLPLLEALGGKKPVAEIADYQYDYLFKVTLRQGEEAKVDTLKYGEPSVAPAN